MSRPKAKKWAERRPPSCCELGVMHAFGPGVIFSTNHQLQFAGSEDRRLRVPLRGLKLICLYGPVRVTAGAIRLVTDAGAGLAYLSASGLRTNGLLQPPADSWRGRRYRQFRAAHDRTWMLGQARLLVGEKLHGVEEAALSLRRQGRAGGKARALIAELPGIKARVASATDHAQLRGLEGIASKRWFEAFDELLPEGWTLPGRRRRPPTDPVNALLSLGYRLLHHRVRAACAAWGLDPALGVHHELRPGRASLACDLMEPFRVAAVDRLILRMLALNRYQSGDFLETPEGDDSIRLVDEAMKRWLTDLETHLHAEEPGRPSFQVRIVDRVRLLSESLPAWEGDWPNSSPNPESPSDTSAPPGPPPGEIPG